MRIATVNVNGIRAAFRKGMRHWLESSNLDILALQEVRAGREDLEVLIGDQWVIAYDQASEKGRAGVAVASRLPHIDVRRTLGPRAVDTAGRWIEVDISTPKGNTFTIVSCYVHSGQAGTSKQETKYKFLENMSSRMKELGAHSHPVVVVGDLNIGHRTIDIKNWRGNLKNAGFLPQERAYLDEWVGAEGSPDYNSGSKGRFVDIGRLVHGDIDGPYTWWSWRGRAFENDTGWRIDYQLANAPLASALETYRVDRAPTYETRWSDHAPVLAEYGI